jgi:hypothetical protein
MELMKRVVELANKIIETVDLYSLEYPAQTPQTALTDEDEAIFKWLLGENGDFPARGGNPGLYWWRTELRERLSRRTAQPAEPSPAFTCEYCGPVCYGGAAHNARVEDKAYYKPEPSPAPMRIDVSNENTPGTWRSPSVVVAAPAPSKAVERISSGSPIDRICEILFRKIGMGRIDNDPIAKEIYNVASVGMVTLDEVRRAIYATIAGSEEFKESIAGPVCKELEAGK